MQSWKNTLVPPETPLKRAMEVIGRSRRHICLVVDGDGRLLGTVTDGDVRRAILRSVGLDEPVERIMFTNPIVGRPGEPRAGLLARVRAHDIREVPLVDHDNRVIGLESVEDLAVRGEPRPNWVALMAGGLGTRLRPLTDDKPKPLLEIGDQPILHTVIDNLVRHDFRRFYVAVNYRAEMVMDALGDGSRWDAEIRYLREDRRLGTAGALSLIDEKPADPLLVMNADLLTSVNFGALMAYHADLSADATMCVREYDIQVPFGVVDIERDHVRRIVEKPAHKFFVNAGIYVLGPRVLEMLPRGEPLDMPDFFEALIGRGLKVPAFPIGEFWMDIGRPDDLRRAETLMNNKGNS